jgi:hypothetical protein
MTGVRLTPRRERRPHFLKMLTSLEDAHVYWVSIFGGVEHLRAEVRKQPARKLEHARVKVADVPEAT